jgi:hypothetical protein
VLSSCCCEPWPRHIHRMVAPDMWHMYAKVFSPLPHHHVTNQAIASCLPMLTSACRCVRVQAASPDEEALVAGAAYLGTKLLSR